MFLIFNHFYFHGQSRDNLYTPMAAYSAFEVLLVVTRGTLQVTFYAHARAITREKYVNFPTRHK